MGEARGWVKVKILFFFISFHLWHSKGGVEVANPITPSASANKGYFINITCASYGIYTKNDTTENNIYLSITICASYSVTNNCGKLSEKVIPLPTATFGSKGSLVWNHLPLDTASVVNHPWRIRPSKKCYILHWDLFVPCVLEPVIHVRVSVLLREFQFIFHSFDFKAISYI